MLSFCCRFTFGARLAYVHSSTHRKLASVVTDEGWRSLRAAELVVLGATLARDVFQ